MEEVTHIEVWHWYSLDQGLAAAVFSRKCGELEASPSEPTDDEKARGHSWTEAERTEHRSYAVAAILASVAFLEASINELCASASHDNLEVGGGRGSLLAGQRRKLVDLREMLESNRLLDKFQLVLHALGKQPFDPGSQPYQDASLLVRLRNSLVHYKPKWRTAGGYSAQSRGEEGILKALADKRFSEHPFAGEGYPFFPDRCLGHGCSSWAWNAALVFADEFFGRLAVTPVHNQVRDRLTP